MTPDLDPDFFANGTAFTATAPGVYLWQMGAAFCTVTDDDLARVHEDMPALARHFVGPGSLSSKLQVKWLQHALMYWNARPLREFSGTSSLIYQVKSVKLLNGLIDLRFSHFVLSPTEQFTIQGEPLMLPTFHETGFAWSMSPEEFEKTFPGLFAHVETSWLTGLYTDAEIAEVLFTADFTETLLPKNNMSEISFE